MRWPWSESEMRPGFVLTVVAPGRASWRSPIGKSLLSGAPGITDHGELAGRTDDAKGHSIYLLLAGRTGGQTARGGTASGEDLTLVSTAHATRGSIFLGAAASSAYDETQDFLGIGTPVPAARLHSKNAALGTSTLGATGTPFARCTYATTDKLDIAPLLNNADVVDVALNVNSGSVQFIDSSLGAAGFRVAFSAAQTFLQAGRLDSFGAIQNKNLTLGGMNATVGTSLTTVFLTQQLTDTEGSTCVGINVDPATFGGGDGPAAVGLLVGMGTGAVRPGVAIGMHNVGASGAIKALGIYSGSAGTSPNLALSDLLLAVDDIGRLLHYNSGSLTGYWDTTAYRINLRDSAARQMISAGTETAWSDSLANSPSLYLGDLIATNRAFFLASSASNAMSRFGVSSAYTLLTNGAPGGANFPAPAAINSPMVAIANQGAVGVVPLAIRGVTSQTGNLQNWTNAANTVLSAIDKDGQFTGTVTGSYTGAIAETQITDGALLARVAANETITGAWTMGVVNTAPITFNLNVDSGAYIGTDGILFDDGGGFKAQLFAPSTAFTANRYVSFPDGSGQIMLSAAIQAIINKTFTGNNTVNAAATNVIKCNTTGPVWQDNTTSTKKLVWNLSGLSAATSIIAFSNTAARTYTMPDASGTIYLSGGTDVAIADGGTGASNAATARTNLGLGSLAILNSVGASNIDNRTRTLWIPAALFETTAKINQGTFPNSYTRIGMAPTSPTQIVATAQLPKDYVSTSIYKLHWAPGGVDMNGVVFNVYTKVVTNAGGADLVAAYDETLQINPTPAGTPNIHVISSLVSNLTPAANDLLRIGVERDPLHAGDTNTDYMVFIGLEITYTADS